MSEPDFLPLRPGLRLEYEVRRAGEVRTLVVEHSAASNGSVAVKRTWTDARGGVETDSSLGEARADGVYLDGERILPRPARAGAAWALPPRSYRIESLDAETRTPAGTFRGCLRVSYLIAGGDGGAGERFYSPGLGLVREVCGDEADPFEVRLTARAGAEEAAR